MHKSIFLLLISLFQIFTFSICAGENMFVNGPHAFDAGPLRIHVNSFNQQNHLEILALYNGAGETAGLKVGDEIFSANGVEFLPNDGGSKVKESFPREALGLAIYDSYENHNGILTLRLRRGNQEINIAVTLPARETDEEYLQRLINYYESKISASGNIQNLIKGPIIACVLLANGDQKHATILRNYAHYLRDLIIDEVPKSNWENCYAGMFLCEYYLATLDETILPAIQTSSDRLAVNTDTGAHNHSGPVAGYGGSGLQIVTTHCVMLWALAEKCGLTRPQPAWDDSVRYFDNGSPGVGYTRGSNSIGDSMGRTANWHIANALAGVNAELLKKETDLMFDRHQYYLFGHAATHTSFWASLSAIYATDKERFRQASKYWRWYTELSRDTDPELGTGIFYHRGRQNSGGDSYRGGKTLTASALLGFYLVLQKEQSKLFIHGGREYGWYNAQMHLTSPSNERQFEENHIANLEAVVNDSLNVSTLNFLLTDKNGNSITVPATEVTSNTWQAQWPTVAGTFELQAVATLNDGQELTSTTQSLLVTNLNSGLLAHYSFNDTRGNTLTDSSDHGYHANLINENNTAINGWLTAAESGLDGAFDFDGNAGNDGAIFKTPQIQGDFKTIAFWWKPNAQVNKSQPEAYLFSSGIQILVNSSTSTMVDETFTLTEGGKTGLTKTFEDQWYHICLVWDTENSRYDFYVDGKKETTIDKYHSHVNTDEPASMISNKSFEISGKSSVSKYSPFAYDDIRIYDRSLTADEIDRIRVLPHDLFGTDGHFPEEFDSISESDASWYLDDAQSLEGRYALRSGDIDHSQISSTRIQRLFQAGTFSTFVKVDAEAGDLLKIFIDDMQTPVATYPGGTEWQEFTHNLTEGEHTIVFSYEKNASLNEGRDTAFIDNIILPPTPEQYDIQYHISGNGRINSSAQSLSFTVNSGESLPTINAVADTGYIFDSWTGSTGAGVNINSAQINVSNVTQNMTFTANFSPRTITLNKSFGNGGSVALQSAPYYYNQDLTITATPNAGKQIEAVIFNGVEQFSKWLEGPLTLTLNNLQLGTNNLTVTFRDTIEPPIVELISPTPNSQLQNNITHNIQISATASSGTIDRVALYTNGLETDDMSYDSDSQTWIYNWPVSQEGLYHIRVRAYDNYGAETLSQEWPIIISDDPVDQAPMTLTNGLLAHYSFEGTGDTINDMSGNDYHGTLWRQSELSKYPVRGQAAVGKGLSFYKINGMAQTPQIEGDFKTLSFYAQLSSEINIDSSSRYIMRFGDNSSSTQLRFGKWTSSFDREFLILNDQDNSGASGAMFADDADTLSKGWHHFAIVWDETESYYDFYVDGQIQIRDDRSYGAASLLGDSIIQLGRASSNWYDSGIDEVRIYDRSLTATEIQALAQPLSERTGSAMPPGFISGGPDGKSWGPSSELSFEGSLALASPDIDINETTWMQTTAYFEAGELSFNYYASGNTNDHQLEFFIDDMATPLIQESGSDSSQTWEFFSSQLTEGVHTLRWHYRKNSATTKYFDVAIIDGLTLPPTRPEHIISHNVNFYTDGVGSLTGDSIQQVVRGQNTSAVTAVAPTGFSFTGWTGALTGSDNPLTISNVLSDMDITANFLPSTYDISFLEGDNGTLSDNSTQSVTYNGNTTPVTAIANSGYRFSKWLVTTYNDDGSIQSNSEEMANPLLIPVITADIQLQPVFIPSTESYSITVMPAVGIHFDDADLTGRITRTLTAGDNLVLNSELDNHQEFRQWTGDFTGENYPLSIQGVSRDMTVTPLTIIHLHRLSVKVETGSNSGAISEKPRSAAYNSQTEFTLTPASGYVIDKILYNDMPQYVPNGQSAAFTYTMPPAKLNLPTLNVSYVLAGEAVTKPLVTISQPLAESTPRVGTPVQFNANVTAGENPVSRVDFYIDEELIDSDTNSADGWQTTWTPQRADKVTFTAVAVDSLGHLGASSNRILNVTSEYDLFLHYTFDNAANHLVDNSGHNYDGGLLNGAVKGQSYLHLDGIDDYSYTGHKMEILPQHTTTLWVRTDDLVQNSKGAFFDNDTYQISVNDYGKFRYKSYNLGDSSSEWTHLAVTNDGSFTRIYYNGNLINTFEEEAPKIGDITLGKNRVNDVYNSVDIHELKIRATLLTDLEIANEATNTPSQGDVSQVVVSSTAGDNGSISPAAATIAINTSQVFSIIPDDGYEIDTVYCSAGTGTLIDGTYTTPALTEDGTVSVTFRSVERYQLTVTATSGGAVTPANNSIVPGESATLTITPENGFEVTSVSCSAGSGFLDGNTYTTASITNDASAHIIFSPISIPTHEITAEVIGIGGSVTPSQQVIDDTQNTSVTIKPAAGYGITAIFFNGKAQTLPLRTEDSYIFTTPTLYADASIEVSFAPFSIADPVVSITSPEDNSDVAAGVDMTVTAEATSERSIDRINFYLNDQLIGIDNTSDDGFSTNLTPAAGTHIITAVAFDSNGNSGSSNPIQINAIDKPGLQVEYLFNQSAGTDVLDTSGNNLHAQFNIADDSAWTSGFEGNAFNTVGSNIHAVTPQINADFKTIAFHFYTPVTITAESTSAPLLSFGLNGADNFIWKAASTGSIEGETITIGGQSITAIKDVITIGWHHLAIVWNGSKYDFYLDGIKRTTFHKSSGQTLISNKSIYVGRRSSSYSTETFDNLVIYDRNISPEEISEYAAIEVKETYTVTASTGPNGSVSQISQTVNSGQQAIITITPNEGYEIDDITSSDLSGQLFDNQYVLPAVSADTNVSISFTPEVTPQITVSAAVSGNGGSVSPSEQTVDSGNTASFTITPDEGYKIDTAIYSSGSGQLENNTFTTPTLTEDASLFVSFTLKTIEDQLFNVNYSVNGSGSVSSPQETLAYNTSTSPVNAIAATGWSFSHWSGDADGTSNPLVVNSVKENKNIIANFTINSHTVTFDLNGKGSRAGGGSLTQSVDYGSAATEPQVDSLDGWEFTGWSQNFSTITKETTITALYKIAGQNQLSYWDFNAYNGDALSGTINPVSGSAELDHTSLDLTEFKDANDQLGNNADNVALDNSCLVIDGLESDGEGFIITLDSSEFEHLSLSFSIAAEPAAQRNFRLEFSTDEGQNWTYFKSYSIEAPHQWQKISADFCAVPSINDHDDVRIRIVRDGIAVPVDSSLEFDAGADWLIDALEISGKEHHYTVTFDLDGKANHIGGGNLKQHLEENEDALAPTLEAHSGWRFIGWNHSFSNITSDITATAQYAPAQEISEDFSDSLNQWQTQGDISLEEYRAHLANNASISQIAETFIYSLQADLELANLSSDGSEVVLSAQSATGDAQAFLKLIRQENSVIIRALFNNNDSSLYSNEISAELERSYTLRIETDGNEVLFLADGIQIASYSHSQGPELKSFSISSTDGTVAWADNILVNQAINARNYKLIFSPAQGGKLEGNTEQNITAGTNSTPVRALANKGYYFNRWSDGSQQNPRILENLHSDVYLTPEFSIATNPIIISSLQLGERNSAKNRFINASFKVSAGNPTHYRIGNASWQTLPAAANDGYTTITGIDTRLFQEYRGTKPIFFELKSSDARAQFSGKLKLLVPKVSGAKVNRTNKIGIFNVPVSFKVSGEADTYSIFWMNNGKKEIIKSGNIIEENFDAKGLYTVQNVNFQYARAEKGRIMAYVEASNEIGASKASKVAIKLTPPKVSSVKVNGKNKTARNSVSIKFKITDDATDYDIYWLDGEVEKNLASCEISKNAIDAKGIYEINGLDISSVANIKGRKTLYVRLSNEVGFSKPGKVTVTLELPKVSSVKINDKNTADSTNVSMRFKLTGKADSYSIYTLDGDVENEIANGNLSPGDFDAKSITTIDNVSIAGLPAVKGRITLFIKLGNEVGFSKPGKVLVKLIGPKILSMGINDRASTYVEGDSVTLVHTVQYLTTHYRTSTVPFDDENDMQAAEWQAYSGTITINAFTGKNIYLQMKNAVTVSNVRQDTIGMLLHPEDWEGRWSGTSDLTVSNFSFEIESNETVLFTLTKTDVDKLSATDALGNVLNGSFNEAGLFEAHGFDAKRNMHMTLSGSLNASNMNLILENEYDDSLVTQTRSLTLSRTDDNIEDFSNRILVLQPLVEDEYSLENGNEKSSLFTYESANRILSLTKSANVLSATDLVTNQKYTGVVFGSAFVLETATDRISGTFTENGSISGNFTFESHNNQFYKWQHGSFISENVDHDNGIDSGTYNAGDLGISMTFSTENQSHFPSQSISFVINNNIITVKLSGYGELKGKIYNGYFTAFKGELQLFGQLSNDESCNGGYIYKTADLFEVGSFSHEPLSLQ